MPRFLIEVEEETEFLAFKQMSDSVRDLGSHFATHADWSRKKGACIGRMIVEAKDRLGAIGIVPPNMRGHAHVSELQACPAM